jgi:hypothetical protein
VGDPVEPRPQPPAPRVTPDALVGVQESLLDSVLGAAARQQPVAIAQQLGAMTLDDDLEREIITRLYLLNQSFVGLAP